MRSRCGIRTRGGFHLTSFPSQRTRPLCEPTRAAGVRFELTKVLPLLAFEASALVHYATPRNLSLANLLYSLIADKHCEQVHPRARPVQCP